MHFRFLKSKPAPKSSLGEVYQSQKSRGSEKEFGNLIVREYPTKNKDWTPKIGLTTIPQYSYTNTECRFWIAAQLRVYFFFLPRSTVTDMAKKFDGSGKKMFAMEREEWAEILGYHGHLIRFLIRRILWNEKRSLRAGLSKAMMNELRGEYKMEEELDLDLGWAGLYPIR